MARTMVFNAENGTSHKPQPNEVIYSLDASRQYKHTMHRVRRVATDGQAVTYCTTWLRYGAVESLATDCAVWCENGCKPTTQEGN